MGRVVQRVSAASALLVGLVCAEGCSANVVSKDNPLPPTPVLYDLDFGSQSNAIGTSTVVVTIFSLDPAKYPDDASRVAFCGTVKSMAQRHQTFSAPDYSVLWTSPEATPCELLGQAGADAGSGVVTLGYGLRAVLAVAKNPAVATPTNGSEILLGCGVGVVDGAATPITVPVTTPFSQFVSVPPPPANCLRLVDKCNNKC